MFPNSDIYFCPCHGLYSACTNPRHSGHCYYPSPKSTRSHACARTYRYSGTYDNSDSDASGTANRNTYSNIFSNSRPDTDPHAHSYTNEYANAITYAGAVDISA